MDQKIKETILRMNLQGFSFSEISKTLEIPYQRIRQTVLKQQDSFYSPEKAEMLANASGEMFEEQKKSDFKFGYCNENYIVEYPNNPNDIMNLGISSLRLSNMERDERVRVLVIPNELCSQTEILKGEGIKILPEEDLLKGKWIW